MSSSTMIRLSLARRAGSHVYLGKFHDFCQWEIIPSKKLSNVIKPIKDKLTPKSATTGGINYNVPTSANGNLSVTKSSPSAIESISSRLVLRGSGLHGPENTDVFRLVLWNRLKQRRPQREVPTIAEMREWNKLEVCCVWFTWGYLLFYWPMGMYGTHFAQKHDHFPWVPARTDGSRGEGPTFWYLE